jgi:hypothetical protein
MQFYFTTLFLNRIPDRSIELSFFLSITAQPRKRLPAVIEKLVWVGTRLNPNSL